MGFCRQEYWCGWPFLSPEDLPNLGIEPRSPALQVDSLPSEPPGKPLEVFGHYLHRSCFSILGGSLLDMPPTVDFLMRRFSSVFYVERGGKGCAREHLDNSTAVSG